MIALRGGRTSIQPHTQRTLVRSSGGGPTTQHPVCTCAPAPALSVLCDCFRQQSVRSVRASSRVYSPIIIDIQSVRLHETCYVCAVLMPRHCRRAERRTRTVRWYTYGQRISLVRAGRGIGPACSFGASRAPHPTPPRQSRRQCSRLQRRGRSSSAWIKNGVPRLVHVQY